MTDMRPDRCPLCGGPNDCGVAAGKNECWCFTAKISAEALAALPDEARGRVCICANCAKSASRGSAVPGTPRPRTASD
jgi:hypothetical protein